MLHGYSSGSQTLPGMHVGAVVNDRALDFLPAAWLVRVNDLKASMTMTQPFPDVWLPRDVDMFFSAMLAIGTFDMRYHLDYHDYRQATTSGRIKAPVEH